jgi:hypothetical protein
MKLPHLKGCILALIFAAAAISPSITGRLLFANCRSYLAREDGRVRSDTLPRHPSSAGAVTVAHASGL